MQLDSYTTAIREDLARIAAIGDENTSRVGQLLAGALEPSVARRLQEALTEAALELTGQLPEGRVEVRLSGGDPELVYVGAESDAAATESVDEALSARVTLRLSDSLKQRIEEAAASDGVSLNSWILRVLGRASEPRAARSNHRHRLTGYGTT